MATNNALNNASAPITLDPGASGDSYIQFDINTTGKFRMGVDDSASDAFKISQGSALGTNDTFIMTANGERTMPLQPCFMAYKSSSSSNVTGDGTTYTIVCNAERFDQNSDFNTSTGTFTAPVTGRYQINVNIFVTNLAVDNPVTLRLPTSNVTYIAGNQDIVNKVNGNYAMDLNVVTDFDAADTAQMQVTVDSGTKTVGVFGNAAPRTHMSGFLVA